MTESPQMQLLRDGIDQGRTAGGVARGGQRLLDEAAGGPSRPSQALIDAFAAGRMSGFAAPAAAPPVPSGYPEG